MSQHDKATEENEEFFNTSGSFDYDLQAETSEMMNQVFNADNYEPVYNPAYTKAKEQLFKKAKEHDNKQKRHRLTNYHPTIYQNLSDQDFSPSFLQFLTRAQEKVNSHHSWIHKMKKQQLQKQTKTLKEVPNILRGSREKIEPIYERCLDLQKNKERKLENKRIQKNRVQIQKVQQLSFKPTVNPNPKQRTFEEYISDKETWEREKKEELQKKRMANEVSKLSQCTFSPILVSKYNKVNSRLVPGEKVEDRLLRSLEKSSEKYRQTPL